MQLSLFPVGDHRLRAISDYITPNIRLLQNRLQRWGFSHIALQQLFKHSISIVPSLIPVRSRSLSQPLHAGVGTVSGLGPAEETNRLLHAPDGLVPTRHRLLDDVAQLVH
jgi:hypothetical protein